MSDQTYIIKPKDPEAIVKLQDPTVVEQLLNNPPAVLAEVITGWFTLGNGFWAAAGCRVVQAAFKGRIFEQFGREFKKLRESGKIPEDFAEKTYGYKSWVELLTILDEEVPDADRLEALKAMFFSVNKANATDGERILAYQLFQIAKKLTAGQLLLLSATYKVYKRGGYEGITTISEYIDAVSEFLGYKVEALIYLDHQALVNLGLLQHIQSGRRASAGLTDLGIMFCENLETYRTEKEPT